MSAQPLQPRSTRPVVPNIAGLAGGAALFGHEFRPVTPRVVGGGGGTATPTAATAGGGGTVQPVVARPLQSQPVSSGNGGHDPFAPRGMISTALAEARALVQGMDGRGGGAAGASQRPASLTEVSRPYTPRLARRSSPLQFQQQQQHPHPSPSGSPGPPSSAGGSLYGSDPFPPGPPDSPAANARFSGGRMPLGEFSPSPSSSSLANDGDDDFDDFALPRPSMSRSKSGARPGSASSRALAFGDELGEGGRPDSAASSNAGSSNSRPSSTSAGAGGVGQVTGMGGVTTLRSRSASAASPGMGMLLSGSRRSPVPAGPCVGSAAQPVAAAAVPALAFPAGLGAGSDDDWRMVESLPGEETSRPGTARVILSVGGLTRQNSAARAAAAAAAAAAGTGTGAATGSAASFPSPSPPAQPRPPSGASPSPGARSRSRPSSSKDADSTATVAPAKSSRPSSSEQNHHGGDDATARVQLKRFSETATTTAAARPSSALFARPLDVPSAAADSKDVAAGASPAPGASSTGTTTTPVLDLAGLKSLHSSYLACSNVVDKPDLLRSLLTASYRALQSARRAGDVIPLVEFVLPLPGGEAGSKLQLLATKLLFEVSREQKNDPLLLQILPLVTERVLARPAERGIKALSYVLGALHNLSVEMGSSSSSASSSSSSPLTSQALVDALASLLRPEIARRCLRLEGEDEQVQLAMEVTGVLRNIACAPQAHRLFVAVPTVAATDAHSSSASPSSAPVPLSALDILCHLTIRLSHHASLLLNLTRILSKLSLHQSCRAIMYAPAPLPLPAASASTAASPVVATGFLPALVGALHVHHVKLSLCIRVLYILGNLTMQNDECRRAIVDCTCPAATVAAAQAVAAREKAGGQGAAAGAVGDADPTTAATDGSSLAGGEAELKGSEVLLSLLARSYQRDSKLRKLLATAAATASAAQSSAGGSAAASSALAASSASLKKHTSMLRENEELLVKLLRLLANVSITPRVGASLVADKRVATLFKILKHKSIDNAEELVLNAVSAVTNLSFYLKPPSSSAAAGSRPASAAASTDKEDSQQQLLLFTPPRDVMALLLGYLFSPNAELLSETCRSLGNFSRSRPFRDVMSAARADEACILLLDHGDTGVVYGAAGVVLNIAAHDNNQSASAAGGGASGGSQAVLFADEAAALHKLADVLQRFSGRDLDAPPNEDEEEDEENDAEPEWGLLSMVLKTFLNLRVPSTTSAPATGTTCSGESQLVLKREVTVEVRMRLLQLLEHILQRCDLERALAAQALAENGGEDEGAAEVSRAVSEVEMLAQQLLPACLPVHQ